MKIRSLVTVIILCAAALLAACGSSTEVRAAKVRKAAITESFSEVARTRLEDRYRITMPLDARIAQVELEPGAIVKKGQTLVEVDRVPLERAVGEARAAVEELRARVALMRDTSVEQKTLENAEATATAMEQQKKSFGALIEAEKWRVTRTQREWERLKGLTDSNAVSKTMLDTSETDAETALIELRRREYEDAMANAQLQSSRLHAEEVRKIIDRKPLETSAIEQQLRAAEDRLAVAQHNLELSNITSPIDGCVLEKYELGGGPLPSGRPLLLLGNLDELEVESEVLSQDAMSLHEGTRVEFSVASSDKVIPGKVRLVRPAGFVKLSSLGVEQQRVIVLCSLEERPENLGVGFRLQARFIVDTKESALLVPRYSVLQAPDESYFIFRIDGRRLRKQRVKLGLRSDLDIEVVDGLKEGDVVVAAPDSAMADGDRVSPRE
ncbi:HlyD family efflux transporter periplasmic adaptor subunit [Candidatus Sumerlaeota bacterium]|nr:HlyD family efflux transporter periplasmic adaptor subunit [Candidatus Sumerlaeota bacterium]